MCKKLFTGKKSGSRFEDTCSRKYKNNKLHHRSTKHFHLQKISYTKKLQKMGQPSPQTIRRQPFDIKEFRFVKKTGADRIRVQSLSRLLVL